MTEHAMSRPLAAVAAVDRVTSTAPVSTLASAPATPTSASGVRGTQSRCESTTMVPIKRRKADCLEPLETKDCQQQQQHPLVNTRSSTSRDTRATKRPRLDAPPHSTIFDLKARTNPHVHGHRAPTTAATAIPQVPGSSGGHKRKSVEDWLDTVLVSVAMSPSPEVEQSIDERLDDSHRTRRQRLSMPADQAQAQQTKGSRGHSEDNDKLEGEAKETKDNRKGLDHTDIGCLNMPTPQSSVAAGPRAGQYSSSVIGTQAKERDGRGEPREAREFAADCSYSGSISAPPSSDSGASLATPVAAARPWPPIFPKSRLDSIRQTAQPRSPDLAYEENGGESWAASTASSTTATSRSQSLIEQSTYREVNLANNHIKLLMRKDKVPDHVQRLVDMFGQDRSSPGPTDADILQDEGLEALIQGAPEDKVCDYCKAHFFHQPSMSEALAMSINLPVYKECVPCTNRVARLSTPVPDLLYGYKKKAFPILETQQMPPDCNMFVNTELVMYPFLAVELKGSMRGMADLWVACNQCLGAGATLVHVAEMLQERAQQHSHAQDATAVGPSSPALAALLNTCAFTVSCNGSEARIYATWLADNKRDFDTQNVASFLITQAEQYRQFRAYIRNIMDWGLGERLAEVSSCIAAASCIVQSVPDTAIARKRARARAHSRGSCSSSTRRSHSHSGRHVYTAGAGPSEDQGQGG